MTSTSTDRIDKQILLHAPRARVWRALTDSREFGAWFGVKLGGSFAVGERITGRLTIPGYDHLDIGLTVERIEPEQLFSFRWHPNAVDTKVDYADEPLTLVEFRLSDAPGGTLLALSESGFDRLPPERREVAWRMNDGGWQAQLEKLRRHVAG